MDFQDIIYEKKGRIAYMTINRPRALNSLSPTTNRELFAAFNDFKQNPDLWVAILSGVGDRAFSAGRDLRWQDTHPEQSQQYDKELAERQREVFGHLAARGVAELPKEIWKPIIAAVNGYCLGGGLALALHCDIIFASETASFASPEVTHGWPGGGNSLFLPRRIPLSIAMEMLLSGDRISAQRAYEVGLVNRVVPADDLMEAATDFAKRLCENPPLALQAAKEIILRGLEMPLNYPPMAWHLLGESIRKRVDDSEDKVEGRRAFSEKRKPMFKGR